MVYIIFDSIHIEYFNDISDRTQSNQLDILNGAPAWTRTRNASLEDKCDIHFTTGAILLYKIYPIEILVIW